MVIQIEGGTNVKIGPHLFYFISLNCALKWRHIKCTKYTKQWIFDELCRRYYAKSFFKLHTKLNCSSVIDGRAWSWRQNYKYKVFAKSLWNLQTLTWPQIMERLVFRWRQPKENTNINYWKAGSSVKRANTKYKLQITFWMIDLVSLKTRGKWDKNKTSFASIDHGYWKSKHRLQTYVTQQKEKSCWGNVEDLINEWKL